MYTIFRGIWPFWYAMGLLIILLLIFPQTRAVPAQHDVRQMSPPSRNRRPTCTIRTHHGSTPQAGC